MYKMITLARTVRCRELRNLNQDSPEKEPLYCINFSVATERNYAKTVKDEEGKETKVRESDFMTCVAYGHTAKTIDRFVNLHDEEGKFISRPVYLEGTLEKFKTNKLLNIKEQIIVDLDGKQVPINLELEHPIQYEGVRFKVSTIEFTTGNPKNAVTKSNGTTIKSVTVAKVATTNDSGIEHKENVVSDNNEDISEKILELLNNGQEEEARILSEQAYGNQEDSDNSENYNNVEESINGDVSL